MTTNEDLILDVEQAHGLTSGIAPSDCWIRLIAPISALAGRIYEPRADGFLKKKSGAPSLMPEELDAVRKALSHPS